MALQPLPKHRKVWYRVANALGAEDKKSIAFLLDIDEVECGVDLFRTLEKRGVITSTDPYSQLIPILNDVGRKDVVIDICSLDPEASNSVPLEYHSSFSGSEQLVRMKRSLILSKRDEYILCMKELKVIRSCVQSRQACFQELFYPIFSQVTIQPDSLTMDSITVETVKNSLISLSLFWRIWPEALARFQCTCSSLKIKHLMESCHKYYDQFCEHVKLDWASDMRTQIHHSRDNSSHPLGQVARKAHHVLDEMSTELLGNQKALSSATSSVKNAMFTIESLNYTTRYLLSIFKWLAFLIHTTGSSKLKLQSIKDMLESLVSDHRVEIQCSWEAISAILGDQLSSELRDLIPVSSPIHQDKETVHSSALSKLTGTVGLVWYATLIILTGISTERIQHFSDEFIQNLQMKILQSLTFEKDKLISIHWTLSEQMGSCMQQEIQTFRRLYVEVIRNLTNGNPDSAKLIESILECDQDEHA